MPLPVRLALALLPLATYFFLLGTWHARRHPTVVPGPRDFGLLAFGLGGLIAFGPVGEVLVAWCFPRPSVAAWMAVASFVGLLAMAGTIRSRRRIVVYHARPSDLTDAVASAFEDLAGPPLRTPLGLQDAAARRGLHVEPAGRLGTGTIDAYGDRPEVLAEALAPALAARLARAESPPSRLATFWYGLAFASIGLTAAITAILTRPEVRAALRRMHGG